eukprot:scaffold5200_cov165-Ochromonas_danica.AAC.5
MEQPVFHRKLGPQVAVISRTDGVGNTEQFDVFFKPLEFTQEKGREQLPTQAKTSNPALEAIQRQQGGGALQVM